MDLLKYKGMMPACLVKVVFSINDVDVVGDPAYVSTKGTI